MTYHIAPFFSLIIYCGMNKGMLGWKFIEQHAFHKNQIAEGFGF